jgi:hypothetical protein
MGDPREDDREFDDLEEANDPSLDDDDMIGLEELDENGNPIITEEPLDDAPDDDDDFDDVEDDDE